ncbi:hypothetical protein E2C01_025293 [Portunus trituberculatus]|uniref:Uncharacterized protein n=1 Tax=Portunus trituberculatus TaxID=210409 RepID=A0A5B7ECY9_PORTR|nr:hypothetical protein [Portunus trituberculatus]
MAPRWPKNNSQAYQGVSSQQPYQENKAGILGEESKYSLPLSTNFTAFSKSRCAMASSRSSGSSRTHSGSPREGGWASMNGQHLENIPEQQHSNIQSTLNHTPTLHCTPPVLPLSQRRSARVHCTIPFCHAANEGYIRLVLSSESSLLRETCRSLCCCCCARSTFCLSTVTLLALVRSISSSQSCCTPDRHMSGIEH